MASRRSVFDAPGVEMAPPPSAERLRERALVYLGKQAASTAQVRAVLGRAVSGWGQRAERKGVDAAEIARCCAVARTHIEPILAELTAARYLDDARFAQTRAERLMHSGRSRRAVTAKLSAQGIDAELLREHVPQDEQSEWLAALRFAKKRRIGPFARAAEHAEEAALDRMARYKLKQKQLGAFARAGFSMRVCERVLALDGAEAEAELGPSFGSW